MVPPKLPVDLVALIQRTLIEALRDTSKANNYIFDESTGDGWYNFSGSVDTYLTSEAIGKAVIDNYFPDLGMPTFNIKATDKGAPEAVLNWISLAGSFGTHPGKLSSAFSIYLDMIKWQRENPHEVHIPD